MRQAEKEKFSIPADKIDSPRLDTYRTTRRWWFCVQTVMDSVGVIKRLWTNAPLVRPPVFPNQAVSWHSFRQCPASDRKTGSVMVLVVRQMHRRVPCLFNGRTECVQTSCQSKSNKRLWTASHIRRLIKDVFGHALLYGLISVRARHCLGNRVPQKSKVWGWTYWGSWFSCYYSVMVLAFWMAGK